MDDDILRKALVKLLRGGGAHATFDDTVTGFAPKLLGLKPAGSPHTPWQLMEHLRIAQRDILEFTRDAKHVSPPFPSGYWPETSAPPDPRAWDSSITAFKDDLREMQQLVHDTSQDLSRPLLHANGETLLSQTLLLATHNSYHIGQLIGVRRALEKWVEFMPYEKR